MTPSTAATYAATYAVLHAAHTIGDHWVQIDSHATAKGEPGPAGRRACALHVATYTATQAAALAAAHHLLGLHLRPRRALLALAVSAASHYAADRQAGHWAATRPRGVAWLAHRTGHSSWLRRDPGAPYLMDQAWHTAWTAVAAAIATGRATP